MQLLIPICSNSAISLHTKPKENDYTCLREDNWATLGCKEVFALHHSHNFLSETLHCRLHKQRAALQRWQQKMCLQVDPEMLVRWFHWPTLKGSLSVLKLMPGTYFNQTGKPLRNCMHRNTVEVNRQEYCMHIYTKTGNGNTPFYGGDFRKWRNTRSSTRHKCRDRCGDVQTDRLSGPSLWTWPNRTSLRNSTAGSEKIPSESCMSS